MKEGMRRRDKRIGKLSMAPPLAYLDADSRRYGTLTIADWDACSRRYPSAEYPCARSETTNSGLPPAAEHRCVVLSLLVLKCTVLVKLDNRAWVEPLSLDCLLF